MFSRNGLFSKLIFRQLVNSPRVPHICVSSHQPPSPVNANINQFIINSIPHIEEVANTLTHTYEIYFLALNYDLLCWNCIIVSLFPGLNFIIYESSRKSERARERQLEQDTIRTKEQHRVAVDIYISICMQTQDTNEYVECVIKNLMRK
jgi:hypothetical protein